MLCIAIAQQLLLGGQLATVCDGCGGTRTEVVVALVHKVSSQSLSCRRLFTSLPAQCTQRRMPPAAGDARVQPYNCSSRFQDTPPSSNGHPSFPGCIWIGSAAVWHAMWFWVALLGLVLLWRLFDDSR